jgi:2-succinyl-6-hydroxy-2,4-cyclohexadiene-1-carboxylate synthase
MDIHVESAGHGPAVLWIHGYTMDSTLWQPLLDLLPGFRHVCVDLPGHGRSGPLRPDDSLPALAARIAAVAEAEQARRVVALSFGSAVALQLAASHPQLVSRLAIAAPTIAGAEPAAGVIARERQLALLYRMTGPGPQMTKLWMTSPPDIFRGAQDHPGLQGRLREVINGHSWAEVGNGAMRSLGGHAHTDEELGRISAATLVVIGDRDMPAFRANAARLVAVVPDCTLVTMLNAGHLCLLERPGQVAGALAAHLS